MVVESIRRGDVLAFIRRIRLCYPRRLRLYWIQDNLSANWTPDIRKFARENNVELVPTPTYASYLTINALDSDQPIRLRQRRLPDWAPVN